MAIGTRALRVVGKKSPSSDVDAGEHVASPMPTPRRATTNCEKVRAMPDAAVSRLQTNTPAARMRRRSVLSDEAAERKPDDGVEQREHRAEQAERRVAQSPLPPDSLADAADDLAIEEVHQVDRKQHDQRVQPHPGPSPTHTVASFALRRDTVRPE